MRPVMRIRPSFGRESVSNSSSRAPGLLRGIIEAVAAPVLALAYRVRAHGPGVADFPAEGPVLVIANHAAYLDGCWLMMALPRPLTPMVLSLYYDLPGVHWLMTRVLGAIRVLWCTYRREAPELNDAVRRLDRGECVLIFPEGWLARRPGRLRRFGQGAWRILRARPNTPVVCCWIEGGWGSFTSHAGGPPLRNKRPDFRRPIDVGVSPPTTLDPAVLEDGRAARRLLMRMCAAARAHVGREPIPLDGVLLPRRSEPDAQPAHA